ncbi:hypothetical protein [Sulfobacillus thermosulfidooxidans]|uniref:hypothetical protein n=1 Tax=Sulfobacillus thermosulfidooxidans TaxID=28034 RepID=UPI00031E9235|nr:hypothetical protein [Sulfobacillus thermosulfidooxidans]
MTAKTKLIGAGAAIAAMLAAMGASSFAQFTDVTTPLTQNFKAGTVQISVIKAGSYIESDQVTGPNSIDLHLDLRHNMAPGDIWTAPFTVTNTGTLPELFTISYSQGQGIFANQSIGSVKLLLQEGPGQPTALNSNDYILLNPQQSTTVMVQATFSINAGNSYQGASGSFSIQASAVQADNHRLAPGDQLIRLNPSQANPPAGNTNPPPTNPPGGNTTPPPKA